MWSSDRLPSLSEEFFLGTHFRFSHSNLVPIAIVTAPFNLGLFKWPLVQITGTDVTAILMSVD